MAEEVGVAYVSLVPSARGWHRAAQREVSREMRGRSLTVPVTPQVDRSAITAALTGLDGGQPVTVPVDVDLDRTQVVRAIAEVERREHLTVDADVDTAELIGETRRAVRAVEATHPTIDVDVDVDRPALSRLLSRLTVDADGRSLGARLGAALLGGLGERTERGIGDVLSGIVHNPIVSSAGIALAAGLTATIGPAIFAAIGGATAAVTLAGTGLGAIFAGAFILSSNPRLQRAWDDFTSGVGDTLREAAEPLVEPLTEALAIIGQAVDDVSPQLREMFAAIAPYVPTLARGVADFIAAFTPGVVDAVSRSGPVIEQIAYALPALGEGLADFLTSMSRVSPEAGRFIGMLLRGLGDVLSILGFVFEVGAQMFGVMADALSWLWDRLRLAGEALSVLGAIIMGDFDAAAAWFVELVRDMGDAWSELWDYVYRGAEAGIGRLIRLVRGLPGQMRAEVGTLGNVLWNAGTSLVRGLINGIRAAIPDLRGTLSWITSMIPSWKGPADRDRRLLEPTGALIMGGLVRGIRGQVPTLRSELGSITGQIGAVGLAGAAGATGGRITIGWADNARGDALLDALRELIAVSWGGDPTRALGG